MATYFISDLHLDAERPELTGILLRFLQRIAGRADGLYILGDLFESWIGDDDEDPLADQIASGLRAVADSGVEIAFQSGNRDFLLGADYAARCRMRRLPEISVVDLAGQPTLLAHGDTLCTDDLAYQAFRRSVRDPEWQRAFLAQPIDERHAFAARARTASAAHQKTQAKQIGDVSLASVETMFAEFGIGRLIHGHTHRPATHCHAVGGAECVRIVLADWRQHGEALVVSDSRIEREVLR